MMLGVSVHDEPIPPPAGRSPRLGYLLKHAELRYRRLTAAALEPEGIGPQQWAALLCLDERHGLSQREAADMLGVDRTTMVALVDELEARGWVRREPRPDDRRKNAVILTGPGREMVQRGGRLVDACERRFLAVLGETESGQLKSALLRVIAADG